MEIESIIENLPTLTERLHTWQGLIKDLHDKEYLGLQSCVASLKQNDIDLLIENKELLESTAIYYKDLFNLLVERLNVPVIALNERINEIKNSDFTTRLKQFRIDSEKELTEKAIGIAESYYESYRPNLGKSDRQYILECKSLVTGFLFTTPYFLCSGKEQRDLYEKEFTGWNPNNYVLLFCKTLDNLFKKQDK